MIEEKTLRFIKESVQCNAALAITRAVRGTFTVSFYREILP